MSIPTLPRFIHASRPALIRCRRDGCEQVLAHYTDSAHTEFEIDVARVRVDKDGRQVVICPACGQRNRLPSRRHDRRAVA